MKDYWLNNKVKEVLQNVFDDNSFDVTDDIICACYLYRFNEYGNKNDYDIFKKIFTSLSDGNKENAINHYLNCVENAIKKNNMRNKEKIKKREL